MTSKILLPAQWAPQFLKLRCLPGSGESQEEVLGSKDGGRPGRQPLAAGALSPGQRGAREGLDLQQLREGSQGIVPQTPESGLLWNHTPRKLDGTLRRRLVSSEHSES